MDITSIIWMAGLDLVSLIAGVVIGTGSGYLLFRKKMSIA
jgi:general stress protein CsbA